MIFIDGMTQVKPAQRKEIRRHVMVGKNKGKKRSTSQPPEATSLCFYDDADAHDDAALRRLAATRYAHIPKLPGSELSLIHFADAVEPFMIQDVLKCMSSTRRASEPGNLSESG